MRGHRRRWRAPQNNLPEKTRAAPGCTRPDKTAWYTRTAARRAARLITDKALVVYRCDGCGLFHLGNAGVHEHREGHRAGS